LTRIAIKRREIPTFPAPISGSEKAVKHRFYTAFYRFLRFYPWFCRYPEFSLIPGFARNQSKIHSR